MAEDVDRPRASDETGSSHRAASERRRDAISPDLAERRLGRPRGHHREGRVGGGVRSVPDEGRNQAGSRKLFRGTQR